MINKLTRLVVADPSLVDARGHHYTLTLQITRGAKQLGIEVIWFTHQDFSIDNAEEGVSVYSIFSATMYDRYKPEKKNTLPSDLEQCLLNELNNGIAQADLQAHDHIYFHTGFGDLYRALPGYLAGMNGIDKPYLHICTPYDLDTMPGKDPGNALIDLFKTLRTLPAVDKKVFFWAETPQLATHYTLTYGFNVRAMPLPPPHGIKQDKNETASDVMTALYLGAAREEKGFLLLPQLAERLYEKYGRAGRLRFIVQCSPQIIGYLPTIKAAMEKLAIFPVDYVKLIDTVMDEKDYHAYLQASDVVLLMYHKKNYRIRGSGIAVEAVCAGKCILTHKGTFCDSLITHGGGAAVEGVNEAIDQLATMIEEKENYQKRAEKQGREYCSTNSVEHYVIRFMNQTRPEVSVPFFPSLIAGHVVPNLLKIA
jgi:glycosyltransferase involved in cell wall biosynthesis